MAYSILIIENNDTLREDLASGFNKAGFTVAAVPGYSAELLKLTQLIPNLIIIDAELPDIAGIEACQQMRSTLGVPVVLLGEDNSDEAWEKALQANIDLYQIKPFSLPVFIARVKAILHRYQARENIIDAVS